MDRLTYKGLLISDFNISNLAGFLHNEGEAPPVEAAVAPFGQVMPVLMQPDLACWQSQPDFSVVWTQPESVSESFRSMLAYQGSAIETILAEVDAYCALLLEMRHRLKSVFVPTWVLPAYQRGLGLLDLKNGGLTQTLMRMNLRLAENLARVSNIYVLDTQRWVNAAGKNAFNPKLWYMAKIPFSNEVFIEATRDIKSALSGISGRARKLIILDLDDTLWGGIVGDVGWENIRLGGHDHLGEAYADFQTALKALTRRGILLGIVSKNEETIALEAIQRHPEMALRLEDFAGWKINWQDKAQNIVDLVSELNLGLQSVVFIDDNPIERARVREALPEVLVPEWPPDKMLYKSALLSLRCFDTPFMSQEDLAKAGMYVSERQRQGLKNVVGSLDEWLKSLNLVVTREALNETNLSRTAQLLNKTNQMNLTTRRMTEAELADWAGQENHRLWTFRVSDRFGDTGLTGIASLEIEGTAGRIVDFVLSCRVMGRKVEEMMLATVIHHARALGLTEVYARYIPTPKNKPCLSFFEQSGMAANGDNIFIWQLDRSYPTPPQIALSE
ncbi:MAG: HAD-IIIC family phosphatase [Anaerolineales bacterium]|nr:HAD-IIIC family phosphatase [Anaerolineales bacterium]